MPCGYTVFGRHIAWEAPYHNFGWDGVIKLARTPFTEGYLPTTKIARALAGDIRFHLRIGPNDYPEFRLLDLSEQRLLIEEPDIHIFESLEEIPRCGRKLRILIDEE